MKNIYKPNRRKIQIATFKMELEDGNRISKYRLNKIANQLYNAGFRFCGKHTRVVAEWEWKQMTRKPFVGEHYRKEND